MLQTMSAESPNVESPDPDEKMPLSHAAALCGVDYDTFLRWVLKGVVPHVVVGPHRSKRVLRREVDKLIEQG